MLGYCKSLQRDPEQTGSQAPKRKGKDWARLRIGPAFLFSGFIYFFIIKKPLPNKCFLTFPRLRAAAGKGWGHCERVCLKASSWVEVEGGGRERFLRRDAVDDTEFSCRRQSEAGPSPPGDISESSGAGLGQPNFSRRKTTGGSPFSIPRRTRPDRNSLSYHQTQDTL